MIKKIGTLLFIVTSIVYGQESHIESKQLSKSEINAVFSQEVKNKHNITFDTYRAYSYDDVKGNHLVLMTHHITKKTNTAFIKENTTRYHDSIKAYFFHKRGSQLKLERTVTDFIKENTYSDEYSISFWTKFFSLDDYDGNGTIDPILIYGTYGSNGTIDGRIKIIILQNGEKTVIRHQNGILDGERVTQIDASFYDLPLGIQEQVVKLMRSITENGSGILPWDWEQERKERQLRIIR